jgi:hypothetical protein
VSQSDHFEGASLYGHRRMSVDGGDELIDGARRGMLGLGISVCARAADEH